MFEKFKYLDYFILIPYLILSAVGIVMVYSASSDIVKMRGENPLSYLIKQAIYVLIGIVLVFIMFKVKDSIFRNKMLIMLFNMLIIIALVYLLVHAFIDPESRINGASAWIPVGPINIQPTEFAKLGIILYLAVFFSVKEVDEHFFRRLKWWPVIIVGGTMLLIVFQPDIGGMTILAAIVIVMTLASGIPFRWGVGVTGGLTAMVGGLFYFLKNYAPAAWKDDYRIGRFLAFFDPFSNEKSVGSQLVNSFYAINNGGLFGVGIGQSIQKKGYLPEPYTDFILAVISEELGVLFVGILLVLLGFLVLRIYLIGIRSEDTFSTLVCYGVATCLLIQSTFNIGGVCGLLPITGVTFPFVSYGGSSMLILSICIGITLNISATEKKNRRYLAD